MVITFKKVFQGKQKAWILSPNFGEMLAVSNDVFFILHTLVTKTANPFLIRCLTPSACLNP